MLQQMLEHSWPIVFEKRFSQIFFLLIRLSTVALSYPPRDHNLSIPETTLPWDTSTHVLASLAK